VPDISLPLLGHNGGPALDTDKPDAEYNWRLFCWRRAHRAVWKSPPRDIVLSRLARAKELGMTYREYTLQILDKGRY
jgi:hypothetical protein